MSINYKEIQAGGTSTDVLLKVDGMDLILEMSSYVSGVHRINRDGELASEVVTLPTLDQDATVSIYLVSDPETVEVEEVTVTKDSGMFVVDVCRQGLDTPYDAKNLIMFISSFVLPKGTTSLEDIEISSIRVV